MLYTYNINFITKLRQQIIGKRLRQIVVSRSETQVIGGHGRVHPLFGIMVDNGFDLEYMGKKEYWK